MEVTIKHNTLYKFDKTVAAGPHLIRLFPSQNLHSLVSHFELKITPNYIHQKKQIDIYGNIISRVVFLEKVDSINFEVYFKANLYPFNPFDFFLDLNAENYPFQYEADLQSKLQPFLKVFDREDVVDFLPKIPTSTNSKTIDFVIGMNKYVFETFVYNLRDEHGVQAPSETIAKKSGSCRDFTWLLINIFRSKGIAARFVSGYLIDLNTEEPSKDELHFHAWVEVYLPGAGWLGMDPTSGLLVSEFYIPLCAVPHFEDAAPITGNTEKCEVSLSFKSSVSR